MFNKMILTLTLTLPLSAAYLMEDGCEQPSTSEMSCDDGIDNDGDGFTDCADYDCTTTDACEGNADTCVDGVDNDGDGYFDCEDFSCSQNCNTADLCGSEEATLEACSDGIDNDGNGFIDCEDWACNSNVCDDIREWCGQEME